MKQGISLYNVFFAVIWTTGVIAGVAIDVLVAEPLTTIFYRLATRRTYWWFWLPENDAENNFQLFGVDGLGVL
jgi:hypothetical protein